MYTQCPHCQTCFRIAEDHLKIANGKVRCGSCQEVFDATQYLFKNLTDREPITYNKPAPAARPAPPVPEPQPNSPPAPPRETEKIDLNRASTPSPQAVEKILNERQKTPDQTPFMESTIGNDRYNNLDQMGAIDIPGHIDFGDSIIKFADEAPSEQKPTESAVPTPAVNTDHIDLDVSVHGDREQADTSHLAPPDTGSENAPTTRTVYEDLESKEAPATDAEKATLENFFAEVDAQLDAGDDKSSLDKDIDELLAFAKGLDQDRERDKPEQVVEATGEHPDKHGIEVSEDFDMQAIADFEKELEASNPGVFSLERPQNDSLTTESSTTATASGKPNPINDDATAEKSEALSEPALSIESETAPEPESAKTSPAEDEEIPRALRHSLDVLSQRPRRSLGMSLLMSLLILILLGGLGFQIILFRNVELAHKFPQLVPELTEICTRIPCRYSGKVDVSQIKLINRDVRSDPNQPNALLISATFVDQAPFDQPYPVIKITLYDLGGNVVASRRFTPKEYLQKMYNRFLLMESGTPVRITLAVLDPGKDAINFEFTFL